jgi:7,8-dihydropterin-6-yl-methyl-4-(beta-D-ribofuranosyl)aminobenzene 5'-phosphate synthase
MLRFLNITSRHWGWISLDFVVLSHRHSDNISGLNYLLRVNPTVKIYAPAEPWGPFGWSAPSSFYSKDESLAANMRHFDGNPPSALSASTPWPQANFVRVGPQGLIIVDGCSHAGVEKILEAATKIDSHIRVLFGGLHLVGASDADIQRISAALHDQWKLDYVGTGHCGDELTFAALQKAFGNRYLYAGVGTAVEIP